VPPALPPLGAASTTSAARGSIISAPAAAPAAATAAGVSPAVTEKRASMVVATSPGGGLAVPFNLPQLERKSSVVDDKEGLEGVCMCCRPALCSHSLVTMRDC